MWTRITPNTKTFHAKNVFIVVTFYIKIFRVEADRHNGILMSLLLLVAETIITISHIAIKYLIDNY